MAVNVKVKQTPKDLLDAMEAAKKAGLKTAKKAKPTLQDLLDCEVATPNLDKAVQQVADELVAEKQVLVLTSPGPAERQARDKPLTQKAQGLVGLYNVGYHTLPYSISLRPDEPDSKLDYRLHVVRNGPDDPAFARPAPMVPRHGFVDSRPVTTVAEVRQVWMETVAADHDGELILQPFVKATFSAVASKSGVVWGPGHDGATAGNQSVSLPIKGFVAKTSFEGTPMPGMPEPDRQMVELVAEVDRAESSLNHKETTDLSPWDCGDAYVVQCREGAAGTNNLDLTEYLPAREGGSYYGWRGRHLFVLGQAKLDMLTWPDVVRNLPRDTLIFHPGGSVLSHWGYWIVQCNTEKDSDGYARFLGYTTTTERLNEALDGGFVHGADYPIVPDTSDGCWWTKLPKNRVLRMDDRHELSRSGSGGMSPLPDVTALPYFTLGYRRGLGVPLAPHGGSRRRLMLAAILVQNGVFLQTDTSGCYALGVAVAMLLRAGLGACIGEFRHRGRDKAARNRDRAIGRVLGPIYRTEDSGEDLLPPYVENRVEAYTRWRKMIPEMLWGFEVLQFPGSSYAGKKWADSARVVAALDSAVQGYLRFWLHPMVTGKDVTRQTMRYQLSSAHFQGCRSLSVVLHNAHALLNSVHNGGLLLNKLGLGQADMGRVANSDLHALGTALPAIGQLGLKPEMVGLPREEAMVLVQKGTQPQGLIQPLVWG